MFAGNSEAPPPARVSLLGPTRLLLGGEAVEIPRLQVRRLAVALALADRQPVSHDALIEVLWDDRLPSDPRAALSVVGSRLRNQLGEARDAVKSGASGWSLDVATDVAEFRAIGAGSERRQLEYAVGLWRGEPLRDVGGGDTFAEVARELTDHHRVIVLALADQMRVDGDIDRAVEMLETIEHDVSDERSTYSRSAALGALGRRSDALDAIDATRTVLRERGLDLGELLTTLELDLLRNTIDVAPVSPPVVAESSSAPFVGRRDEIRELATVPTGSTAVVAEAGGGKTALLSHMVGRWTLDGHTVFMVTAAEHPDRPVDVVSQLVAQAANVLPPDPDDRRMRSVIARIVPELANSDEAIDAITRESMIAAVSGYLRTVCTSSDAVIVIDDVHWTDVVSSEVMSQLDDLRIVLGARPNARPAGARLLQRADRTIELGALSVDDVSEWFGPESPFATRAGEVVGRTGGNPLFVRLLVDLVVDGVDTATLPGSVLVAVQRRLDTLSDRARRTVMAAAVFGLSAPLAGVESVVPGSTTDLAEAAAIGLVIVEDSDVHFVHQLVQEAATTLLGAGPAVAFHEMAGDYLRDAGASAIEVARHYDAASVLDPVRAARAHVDAATEAAAVFDWDTVMGHVDRGLDLVGDSAPLVAAELIVWAGEALRVLHSNHVDISRLVGAARTARDVGNADLFARAVIGVMLSSWELGGDVDSELIELHRSALSLELEPTLETRLSAVAATLVTTTRHAEARERFHAAMDRATALGDPTLLADVLRFSRWGLSHPDDLGAFGASAIMLNDLAGQDLDLFWAGATNRFAYGVMAADRETVDAAIRDLRRRHIVDHRAPHEWDIIQLEIAFALFGGDVAQAELWLADMYERATASLSDSWAMPIYGLMLMSIRREQGRFEELMPLIDVALHDFDDVPAWHCVAAAAAAAAGDLDRARRELRLVEQPEFRPFPNMTWTAAMLSISDVVVALQDQRRAADLLERLHPYRSRVAWTGVCPFGIIADSLADLAGVVGDTALAAEYRREAEEVRAKIARRNDSPPLADRGQADIALSG